MRGSSQLPRPIVSGLSRTILYPTSAARRRAHSILHFHGAWVGQRPMMIVNKSPYGPEIAVPAAKL